MLARIDVARIAHRLDRVLPSASMPTGHYFVKGNQYAELTPSPNGYALRTGSIGTEGELVEKTFRELENAEVTYQLDLDKLKADGFRRTSGKPVALKVISSPAQPTKSEGVYLEDGERFIELIATPTSHRVRTGAIGTAGTTTTTRYASATESYEAYKAAIGVPGYRWSGGDVPMKLVAAAKREASRPKKPAKSAPPAVAARDAKLEAAIEADPDRADAYLVYADWLQSKGDPRGELIVLQHDGKTAAANKLLHKHAAHFLGEVADHQDLLVPHEHHTPRGRSTTWRWGFLEAVYFGNKDGVEPAAFDAALAALLDHPSARFLRELTIGIRSTDDNAYATVAKVIGKRKLPTLRKLFIGDFSSEECELNWTEMGAIEPLYAAVPNLESLTLRSGSMKLGKLLLPKLEELRTLTGGLDKKSLAAITGQTWPHLEILNLQLGDESAPALKLADLAPIFAATRFPKVTHLGLGNAEFSDDIAKELARSKIAAQLVHLDLSEGTLGDGGALALAAGTWRKLASIDVHDSWLTKRGIAALKTIAKSVELGGKGGQQDDEGDPTNRYVSGNE